MADLPIHIVVEEKSYLRKYQEGADPAVDEPFEVVENTRILTQEEVQALVDQGRLRITPEGKAEWVPFVKQE